MSFVPHPVQLKSNSSNVAAEICNTTKYWRLPNVLDFLEADAIGDQHGGGRGGQADN